MVQTPVLTAVEASAVEAVPAPAAPSADAQPSDEAERMNAVYRLARGRLTRPELHVAETKARVGLAVAILAMGDAETSPGQYSLDERLAVDDALTAYGKAVAALLLNEKPDA